jgi:hypothetical protein
MFSFFIYVFIIGTILLVAFLSLIGLMASHRQHKDNQQTYDPNVIDVEAIDVDDTDNADTNDPQLKP